ncbi:hypothetical protein HPB48_017328 [Haemaphysalis longicornis]|uniref:Catalase core domain-containing protein n=1 Tax=Haemaphysalis longicornis TaxID=44386 RepID=A0A9J6GYQ9_HAELO|nr:hypothetical protein HPB48_017328 [Haemaphysalis longicornis]
MLAPRRHQVDGIERAAGNRRRSEERIAEVGQDQKQHRRARLLRGLRSPKFLFGMSFAGGRDQDVSETGVAVTTKDPGTCRRVRPRELMGKDPDYYIRDLYNSIASRGLPDLDSLHPSDDVRAGQVLDLQPLRCDQAESHQLLLRRRADSHDPSEPSSGIEPSPDKLLQGRLFSYGDSQRHRLGPNFNQLPVNCPLKVRLANYERDGNMAVTNQGGAPNYFPNSFSGPVDDAKWNAPRFASPGDVDRWNSSSEDNFTQPREFWEALSDEERDHLTTNIANHLKDAQDFIRKRAVANFASAHPDFGAAVSKKLDELLQVGRVHPGAEGTADSFYLIREEAIVRAF